MQRRFRLRSNSDFQRARRLGRSYPQPLLVLYAARVPLPHVRIGISVGKRVGNAVVRNRVKRIVREVMRPRIASLPPGWDLLFIARSGAANATYQAIDQTVDNALRRCGLLRRAANPEPPRADPEPKGEETPA